MRMLHIVYCIHRCVTRDQLLRNKNVSKKRNFSATLPRDIEEKAAVLPIYAYAHLDKRASSVIIDKSKMHREAGKGAFKLAITNFTRFR